MSSIQASEVKKICLACEAGAGSSLMVKNGLIKKAKKMKGKILTIGITNQRETTILWNKKNGKVVHKAIVWQDRRTEEFCKKQCFHSLRRVRG